MTCLLPLNPMLHPQELFLASTQWHESVLEQRWVWCLFAPSHHFPQLWRSLVGRTHGPRWIWCDRVIVRAYHVSFLYCVFFIHKSSKFFFQFYWSTVDLQCCISVRCTANWIWYTHTHTYIFIYIFFFFFKDSFPIRCCCCLAAKPYPTLRSSGDCSAPGCPVLRCLQEFAQTHVQSVSGAIQSSHFLLPSFPPALNLSQHQGLFQWAGSFHQVAKVLKLQLQHQSFQWIFRVDLLAVQGAISSLFSSIAVWKHLWWCSAFFIWSNSFPI